MILLQFQDNGVHSYVDIGREFSILQKDISPQEFQRCCKIVFGDDPKEWSDNAYAFIIYEHGSNTRALFKKGKYVIMSDSVEMFKDISFK